MNGKKMMWVATALLTAALSASAHHSAVQFDFTKEVEIKGEVTVFRPINPHMQMVLRVTDAKGTHEVSLEGHSTNNMYRNGYRKGMINVGDTVTVSAAPLRNGDMGGYVIGVKLADGTFFGAQPRPGTSAGEETRRQAEGR